MQSSPVKITELAPRDAHQSLLATRLRLDDLLPIAGELDKAGFWSVESWGGATFDSCIRFLGEDPWVRIRELSKAMPNTPQQMLLRGQNLLGYRHYADDLVGAFVERAVANGVGVFRVFDALNDLRNIKAAVQAVLANEAHAQGALCYTLSPVHNQAYWLDLGKRMEDTGVNSIAIKDMAGLLSPRTAFDLVTELKQHIEVPLHLHSHATTGWAPLALARAIEAGIDGVDTAISPMSGTYSHTATETIVSMLEGDKRDTGISLDALEPIATHFRRVRNQYQAFEGSLKGIDARIIKAQVPGGMLTNLESQLQQQNALDRFDELLEEIPRVRADLGYIPLVTPTSQIVGTQAVLNLLSGKPYSNLSYETQALVRGDYGATPAPVADKLRLQVLGDSRPNTARPADALGEELPKMRKEFAQLVSSEQLDSQPDSLEDMLTYAMFKDTAVYYLRNRHDFSSFAGAAAPPVPPPAATPAAAVQPGMSGGESYRVNVQGIDYQVMVCELGVGEQAEATSQPPPAQSASGGKNITTPLAGTVLKMLVQPGSQVGEGDVVCLVEAMKMETEVRSRYSGTVAQVKAQAGDQVASGALLLTLQ